VTPRRLLVTGGAGFIGANFTRYWLGHHAHDHVVVLDALTYSGNLASLDALRDHPSFRFVHGDIRDAELVASLFADEAIDTVVHFAAESHVDRSIYAPDAFLATNVLGTHELLKAAVGAWGQHSDPSRHRFHHVSTDEVYGSLGPDEPPFTERTPYAPNSPYAASKAASDHIVRAYHHTYGLPVTTTNCSNNFGPFQFPEKLIPLMIVNALDGRPLPVYGDGLQLRDWLHVDDHCRGIEAALDRGIVGETYNLGGNCQRTNIDVVLAVCRAVDDAFASETRLHERFPSAPPARRAATASLVAHVADRPGHDRRYAVDTTRASRELGYRVREDFDVALRSTVNWFVEHERWWRRVMDGSYRSWIAAHYRGAV
jgi:dTDP-glucose 4,6-dehydratase